MSQGPSYEVRCNLVSRGSKTFAPTPEDIDFTPGELLGSVSGELGLRKYLEGLGHTYVVTSDKEGADSVFDRELPDADIVISQPFWPAYLTPERIAKAKKLKLAITAGIGSPRGPRIRHQAWRYRRRSNLLQQHQRIGARGHDDPFAGTHYLPSYEWVLKGG
jgi:formate dehydrogenase